MKCLICGKGKKKWFVCDTCYEILKIKYPRKKDLEKALKEHKREQSRR